MGEVPKMTKIVELSCLNIQECDDPATRGCVKVYVNVPVFYCVASCQVTSNIWCFAVQITAQGPGYKGRKVGIYAKSLISCGS